MAMLCSLPWCRKPIASKRQCRKFPPDRPSQLAWLDALDAGNWFSIPSETLSTGLMLCTSHFDARGNIKRRYETPADSEEVSIGIEPSSVKLEPEDFDAESEDDNYLEDNDDDDVDYEDEGSSRSKSKSPRSNKRQFRLNIVHMKSATKEDGKRRRSSTKVQFRQSESETDFLDILKFGNDPLPGSSRAKATSLDTLDQGKLAQMTKEAFRSKSKPRDESKPNQRMSLSLLEKMEIIRLSDRGLKQSQISKKVGVKKSTICGVLSNRDKVEEAYHGGASLRRKVRKGAYDEINQALYSWYQKVTSQNLFVNTRVLMTMAENIANELGRTDFKGSPGWLDRFKQRYNIRFGATPYKPRAKKMKAECSETSNAVDGTDPGNDQLVEADSSVVAEAPAEDERVRRAKEWLKHIWEECRIKNLKTNELYSEKDVFFVEEIGILYRITPKLAWQFRSGSENLPEFSITDERITVLFCSNADGSEKRKLLVAGGQQAGMVLPANLPVDYVVTPDSSNWITKPMFLRWLNKWNSNLELEKRHILLLLSSAPIHLIKKKMSHITLANIPTHHLFVLQPANFGITKSLRARYRRLLLEKIANGGGNTARLNCCDALFLLSTAWNELPPSLIRAAFVKAGFFKGPDGSSESRVEEFDCANLLSKVAELGFAVPQAKYSFLDYVAIDESLYAVECSVSEIVTGGAEPEGGREDATMECDDEGEDLSAPETNPVEYIPVPCNITAADAQNNLTNLRAWAMSRPSCPLPVHNALSTLESFILGHF